MVKLILRRILQGIPVLFFVITLTFFLIRFVPGGPFDAERTVPEDILKTLQERYHLNDPLLVQYGNYIGHLLTGDFGPSFKYSGRTVQELILTGLPVTAELGIYALFFALITGLAFGMSAAIHPKSWKDTLLMSTATLGMCVPAFVLGPVLVLLFAIWQPWLPVSGWDSWAHKILPSLTLGTAYGASIARLTRTGFLETLSEDYIRTARAKGASEIQILLGHALKGGILPVVSYLGPASAGLLSGSFVVETIFQIPGLGRFYVQAAFNRDYTMIMGTTIFLAFLVVSCNLLSDILLYVLNPKLRSQMAETRGAA